jgi:hypothetical protein
LNENDQCIEEAYNAWRDLENATYQRIWNILKLENDSGKANHILSGIGTYYIQTVKKPPESSAGLAALST